MHENGRVDVRPKATENKFSCKSRFQYSDSHVQLLQDRSYPVRVSHVTRLNTFLCEYVRYCKTYIELAELLPKVIRLWDI